MNSKTSSRGRRSRRNGQSEQPRGWVDGEGEGRVPEDPAAAVTPVGEKDELRQMLARRRLEQYLESKRLQEHLREIYYDDER